VAVRKSKAPARKPAARPAKPRQEAKPATPGRDVTQYADKEPTELHKTMARWIVTEVGYDPNTAGSKREAFLMGVSIATAARPAFTSSEYLAAWYEESGTPKRGRGASATSTRRPAKAAPAPEPEEDDVDEVEESDDDLAALEEELNGLSIGALRKAAKEEYAVSGSGTKAEIINRILDSLADEDADDDDAADDEGDVDEEPADDLDELREELEELSTRDLQAAAKEYGVTPKRGERKEALIDRILDAAEEADDEEEDEEEEEPPTKSRKGGKAAPGKASKEFLF